jgi:hypothetical protein
MLSGTVRAGLGRRPATVPFCAFLDGLLLLLLPPCGAGPPVRFLDSSFSIFLRRDFSFPAKFEEDSDRERVAVAERDTDEWYRGRWGTSSTGGVGMAGAEGSEGNWTDPRLPVDEVR